ncbi:MAG TPA: ATP-binding protein [Streptosporangiaceae bacterium]|nr:ATP-binding protein [Streptosporangiaceae bacterium]
MVAACAARCAVYGPAPQPATAWPLLSYLELAAWPTAVPCFRLYARAVALEWGVAALAAKIELIVSERLTNGIRISQRSPGDVTAAVVRLWLTTDLHCVLIRVWDGSGQMPVRRNVKTDEESGRGLMLVEYVASERGSYRVEDGKVVWAVVG